MVARDSYKPVSWAPRGRQGWRRTDRDLDRDLHARGGWRWL